MDKVVSGNYDKIMKLINKTIQGGDKGCPEFRFPQQNTIC
jgi:hypothetical protein